MHSYIALCDHFLKGREGAGLIGIIGLVPWIFLCRWVFLPAIKFFLWNGGFIVSIKRLFVLGLCGAIFEVGSLILSDAKNGYIVPVIRSRHRHIQGWHFGCLIFGGDQAFGLRSVGRVQARLALTDPVLCVVATIAAREQVELICHLFFRLRERS